jgi:spore coat polysaccharide biosynthesis predicted glycosyltransferase SpsG
MKALIITEGGKEYGHGHVCRCLSLRQAFRLNNIDTKFLIDGDESVKKILKNNKYKIVKWIKTPGLIFKKFKKFDIVVVDSYKAKIKFYMKISENYKLPVFLDDNNRLDYSRGLVVNPSIYGKNLKYKKYKDVLYLLGPEYILLRKEFWHVNTKKIKKIAKKVVVILGGANLSKTIFPLIELLNKKFPFLEFDAIIAQDINNKSKENELHKKNNIRFFHYPKPEKLKSIMENSDFAISAGGQTLYELIRLGLPTIGINLCENQFLNTVKLHEKKIIKFAGWYNDKLFISNLFKSINEIKCYKTRLSMSTKARSLIDGFGSIRLVKFLVTFLKEKQ